MRRGLGLLLVLLACNGTEPEYPPFDGPAPTVSDVVLGNGRARAIIRDPQGAITVGRTDYTYVFFSNEGTTGSHLSFAQEWTWTRIDNLTWLVTVPGVADHWTVSGWHVADEDSNVKIYRCPRGGTCIAIEEPV
jgi:hypothetical protein